MKDEDEKQDNQNQMIDLLRLAFRKQFRSVKSKLIDMSKNI